MTNAQVTSSARMERAVGCAGPQIPALSSTLECDLIGNRVFADVIR